MKTVMLLHGKMQKCLSSDRLLCLAAACQRHVLHDSLWANVLKQRQRLSSPLLYSGSHESEFTNTTLADVIFVEIRQYNGRYEDWRIFDFDLIWRWLCAAAVAARHAVEILAPRPLKRQGETEWRNRFLRHAT